MTTSTRIPTVIAVFLALSALAPASLAAEANVPPAPSAPQLPSIYVVEAVRDTISETVVASGYIRPVEEVYVQPEVEGLAVESSAIDIGQTVEKGAVMAVLSDDALLLQKSQLQASRTKAEAALAQSKAQLAEAQANADEAVRVRDRYQSLSKNGTVSRADYDQATASADAALARVNSAKQNIAVAEADIAVAQAQIDDVDLRLERTEVKAPVSGVVSAKNIKIGAIASASGDPLFTIIENGALELRAEIAEGDMLEVKPGQSVTVNLPGQREAITGKVRLVDPTVDLTSRLGTVRVSFDQPERVRAGMFASATILVERKSAVVVPISAVSMANGEATVLKVSDGRVKITRVETGIEHDGRIEIAAGLGAGDRIVAKAGAFVRDGDRVHAVPLAHASAEAAAVTTADD